MSAVKIRGKTYDVDSLGFLLSYSQWDADFAEGTAPHVGIPKGLSKKHWQVIHFIRQYFKRNGRCPLVYETCRRNGLYLKDFENLFPSGYLRGACMLAGITYNEEYVKYSFERALSREARFPSQERSYVQ